MSNLADVEIRCTICGTLYSDACEHIINNNRVINGELFGPSLIERAVKGEITINGKVVGCGDFQFTIDNATYHATTNREFPVTGAQELRNREEIGRINREMLGPVFDSRDRRNGETVEEYHNRILQSTHYSGLPHNLLPVYNNSAVPGELPELYNEMITDIQERFLNEEDVVNNILTEKSIVKIHISKVTDRINRLLDQQDD